MSAQERRPETDGRDFADAMWSIPSMLLAGMAIYGGLGWLLDRWLDMSAFFPIGTVLGLVLAGYLAYRKFSR
ncbi:Putative F0F1-ATPase subunit Ca2+/Mg2+ transporter [Nonomuraea solani]|uniref:Putative F0F1-ATPase subunit Ca2+/Mg2+ transporter n=1 Tax=Nonomuraea solani TaxID=1144553 RepID=A0A1H6BC68_9ACTN|nr:AtpZ/AtpI family protein [Nonomuraea solani]SEG58240.1 Putative F0F1-ATPase subunit Ca2+/Mg2+ transporter [Nonomuraea solani]